MIQRHIVSYSAGLSAGYAGAHLMMWGHLELALGIAVAHFIVGLYLASSK